MSRPHPRTWILCELYLRAYWRVYLAAIVWVLAVLVLFPVTTSGGSS